MSALEVWLCECLGGVAMCALEVWLCEYLGGGVPRPISNGAWCSHIAPPPRVHP